MVVKRSVFHLVIRRDHLGNNREVWLANTNTTTQRTQYYPSGLPWASNTGDNPSTQLKKYNGKEFLEMHGYDTYDYGARGYYPAANLIPTVDPLCEKYYSISPYAYCAGNPVNRIDPDGREVFFYSMDTDGKWQQLPFEKLDQNLKEVFYAFAKSKNGNAFLKNFVTGKQTFSLDKNNSITIEGNGNNFDAQYQFGKPVIKKNDNTDKTSNVYGITDWSKNERGNTNMLFFVATIGQDISDIVATFGHEFSIHAMKDVEYLNGLNGKINQNTYNYLNSSGDTDHRKYADKNSIEYKTMRQFLFLMKGYIGDYINLEQSFKQNYDENSQNIK